MATYNFSYSVIATDNDARAATPTGNSTTVSGSHAHTPAAPVLSPFTSGLGFGGSLNVNLDYYSGSENSENINASIVLTFGSTTWDLDSSRSPSSPGGWSGSLPSDGGTYRTGTNGSVEVNVNWSSTVSGLHASGGAGYSTGWTPIGSVGALVFYLDLLGDAGIGSSGTTQSGSATGTLSVSMRYAEDNSVSGSGSQGTSISLTTHPGSQP